MTFFPWAYILLWKNGPPIPRLIKGGRIEAKAMLLGMFK